nr:hypothetical protein [Geobacillus sp. 46C-IIa]
MMQQREITIDIQYLSEEETNAKNVEMADLLNDLFRSIAFDGLTVNIVERRFEIVDDILHFFLDLDFIVMLSAAEQQDLMQEIIHNREVL